MCVIDVGCVLDTDSDVMLSSGSVLMSSTGGSDGIMDESWIQLQQLDVDEHPAESGTSPDMNYCPLDAGNSSKTTVDQLQTEQHSCQADGTNIINGNAVSEQTSYPATGSSTSVIDSSNSDTSDFGSHRLATSVNSEQLKSTEKECVKATEAANEEMQISGTTENDGEQNWQELVQSENDESVVEEPVSVKESEEESSCFLTAGATQNDTDLKVLEQASDEIQKASNLGVEETQTLTGCQLSPSHETKLSSQTSVAAGNDADSQQLKSTCVDSSIETAVNPHVKTKTQIRDHKNVENQTTTSKQRLQRSSEQTSSKKETDSSAAKPKDAVERKDKPNRNTRVHSSTNPRSTNVAVTTTSKERSSRGSTDTEQTASKDKPETTTRERDKVDGVPASNETGVVAPGHVTAIARKTLKGSPSSDRTTTTVSASSSSVARRVAVERSNQKKESQKEATANVASKETDKIPVNTKNKKTSTTAGSETKRRSESQKPDSQQDKAGDKSKETASKMTKDKPANNNPESGNQTRFSGGFRDTSKATSSSNVKSSLAKGNPGPEDAEKYPEKGRGDTQSTTRKQRMKSADLNPTVSGNSTAATDQPADKLPKDSSTAGNPGNPRSKGDRATTSGDGSQTESKDSSLSTRRPRPERSVVSRATVDKSALPGRTDSQTTKSKQHTAKSGLQTSAGDSKDAKSSGKYRNIVQ